MYLAHGLQEATFSSRGAASDEVVLRCCRDTDGSRWLIQVALSLTVPPSWCHHIDSKRPFPVPGTDTPTVSLRLQTISGSLQETAVCLRGREPCASVPVSARAAPDGPSLPAKAAAVPARTGACGAADKHGAARLGRFSRPTFLAAVACHVMRLMTGDGLEARLRDTAGSLALITSALSLTHTRALLRHSRARRLRPLRVASGATLLSPGRPWVHWRRRWAARARRTGSVQ